ncbi:hypothetical protein ACLIKD_06850 [Azonexus sp. IMCC34842]|uniref:hypothetical protein n=1 Tax=Azonexus sp. IMCC34842 TaxID=3420950 RepID=UPI003D1233CA
MSAKSKAEQPKEAGRRPDLDPLAVADIESGISSLNVLVEYIEGEQRQAMIDDDQVLFLTLTAILAMAQKAGATIERGYGIAIGDGVGNGAGLIGNADAWMTDPTDRKRRHELRKGAAA